MHSEIKIDDSKFRINKSRYSSIPALIEGYMRKPETDAYHLSRGLTNPNVDNSVLNRISRRDQPESLLWYHGTADHQVKY